MNHQHPDSHTGKRTTLITLLILSSVFLAGGCVSSRYKKAKADTPPPVALNIAFPATPLDAALRSVITYNGAGSWKRNAFWDEYVVALHNPGTETLIVNEAELTDYSKVARLPGSEPWALEKQSKTLEQQYKDKKIAFVRYAAPGILIAGTGAATVAGSTALTWTAAGGISTGAGMTAAAATVVALPVYYVTVVTINHFNKVAIEKEFKQRCATLPLSLAAGETRIVSFFFPMGPSPRSLALRWRMGDRKEESALSLECLKALHVEALPTQVAAK